MLIDLTDKECEQVRMALRDSEERHKKNGFGALAEMNSNLRNKIVDAILDFKRELV